MLLKLFGSGYDKLYYLDADAFITNPAIRLESVFDFMAGSDYPQNFYITVDAANNVNTGSFFMIKSSQTSMMLDVIWLNKAHPYHWWTDNGSLIDLYERCFAFRKATRVEFKDRKFNAYPKSSYGFSSQWAEGDFVVHFAGLHGEELSQLIAQFSRFASA